MAYPGGCGGRSDCGQEMHGQKSGVAEVKDTKAASTHYTKTKETLLTTKRQLRNALVLAQV